MSEELVAVVPMIYRGTGVGSFVLFAGPVVMGGAWLAMDLFLKERERMVIYWQLVVIGILMAFASLKVLGADEGDGPATALVVAVLHLVGFGYIHGRVTHDFGTTLAVGLALTATSFVAAWFSVLAIGWFTATP